MDQLSYHYQKGNNRLDHIRDSVPGTAYGDITNQPANNYTYNDIGQLTGNKQDGHYFRYDVTGKVTGVYGDANHTSPIAAYAYDDRGFRIKKTDPKTTTHYVRDAAGSILAVYQNGALTELPVYGAGRLGIAYKTENTLTHTYELSDHLGSVRAVVQRKNNTADVTTAADYYPFGWRMPDRVSIGGERYRFGYQGQFSEYDEETGYNHFEARLLDTRIGRWLATDPAGAGFSPYWSMSNNPIALFDPDGRDDIYYSSDLNKETRIVRKGPDRFFLDGVLQGGTMADAFPDAIIRPPKVDLGQNVISIADNVAEWMEYGRELGFVDITKTIKKQKNGFYYWDVVDKESFKDINSNNRRGGMGRGTIIENENPLTFQSQAPEVAFNIDPNFKEKPSQETGIDKTVYIQGNKLRRPYNDYLGLMNSKGIILISIVTYNNVRVHQHYVDKVVPK